MQLLPTSPLSLVGNFAPPRCRTIVLWISSRTSPGSSAPGTATSVSVSHSRSVTAPVDPEMVSRTAVVPVAEGRSAISCKRRWSIFLFTFQASTKVRLGIALNWL